MTLKFFQLMAFCLLASFDFSNAQVPVLPEEPLLGKMPNPGSWMVSIKLGKKSRAATGTATIEGEGGGKDSGDIRIVTVQSGTVRHEVRSRQGKVLQDIWKVGNVVITVNPDSKKPFVVSGSDPNGILQDFPGLDWISKGNFVGIQKIQERDTLVFRHKVAFIVAGTDAAGDTDEQVEAFAYIDAQSRFPIKMTRGDDEHTFTYLPAPKAAPQVPQSVQALVVEAQATIQRNNIRPTY